MEVDNFKSQCFQHSFFFAQWLMRWKDSPSAPKPSVPHPHDHSKSKLQAPPAPQVYLFSKAAVTNFHKLSDLQQ